MSINWQLLWDQRFNLMQGAGVTLILTVSALAIGIVLGLVIALMRISKTFVIRFPATAYVEIFRCTPMLLQILLIYYGLLGEIQRGIDSLPFIEHALAYFGLPPINLVLMPALHTGIMALGLNSAAYLGEIFRGGIQSIDKGQMEAALSLGMEKYQSMIYVVLPQALTNSLPAMGNEFVTLIKDSSLVSVIAVKELLQSAILVGPRTLEYTTMYLGAGIIYFAMCFTTSRLLAYYEKKRRVGER